MVDVSNRSRPRVHEIEWDWVRHALEIILARYSMANGPKEPEPEALIRAFQSALCDPETGVLSDHDKVALMKLAADTGDPEAMRHLGAMYGVGAGVNLDIARSKRLLTQSIEAGSPYARATLEELQRGWQ